MTEKELTIEDITTEKKDITTEKEVIMIEKEEDIIKKTVTIIKVVLSNIMNTPRKTIIRSLKEDKIKAVNKITLLSMWSSTNLFFYISSNYSIRKQETN